MEDKQINELEKLVHSLDTGMMDLDILMEKYNEHSLDAEQKTKLITMLQAERITEEERLQKLIERTKNLDKESLEQQVKNAREKLDLTKQNATAYNKVLKYANSQGWEQDARDTFTDAVTRTAMYTYNQPVPNKNEGADTVGVSNKQLGKELYEIREAHGILNELEGDLKTLEESTETIAKYKNNIANIDKILADLTGQQAVQQDKVEKATDSITESKQKQVTIQQQMVKAQEDEANTEEKISEVVEQGTNSLQQRLEAIDKLTGMEPVKATEEFVPDIKSDEVAQNPEREKHHTLDYSMDNAFDDLKKARTSPEAIEQVIAESTKTITNALEKESDATKQITDSVQKQVDAQEQSNNLKKEEAKIEGEIVDNAQKLVNLETQRKRILSNIKYTKEDMLSDDELDKLKEDLELNKEKTRELRKQGETAKFLEKVKEDAEEGQSAKLANKRLQEIFKNQAGDYSKYGITDTAKFIKEQKQLGVLANEVAGLKEDIKIQEELNNELVAFDEELKAINQKIEELNTNKKDNLQLKQVMA